jgi:hypothetical protein
MAHKSQVLPVKIDDQHIILAEVQLPGSEEDVAATVLNFGAAADAVEGIARHLSAVFESVKPDKASVEFGIQLSVKAGKLTALLVSGEGNASLKIGLHWGGTGNGH